jgi:hypothetical protein
MIVGTRISRDPLSYPITNAHLRTENDTYFCPNISIIGTKNSNPLSGSSISHPLDLPECLCQFLLASTFGVDFEISVIPHDNYVVGVLGVG